MGDEGVRHNLTLAGTLARRPAAVYLFQSAQDQAVHQGTAGHFKSVLTWGGDKNPRRVQNKGAERNGSKPDPPPPEGDTCYDSIQVDVGEGLHAQRREVTLNTRQHRGLQRLPDAAASRTVRVSPPTTLWRRRFRTRQHSSSQTRCSSSARTPLSSGEGGVKRRAPSERVLCNATPDLPLVISEMERASSRRTLVPTVAVAKPGPQASLWAPITRYRSRGEGKFIY